MIKRTVLVKAIKQLYPAIASNPIIQEMSCIRFKDDILTTTDGLSMIRVKLEESTGLDCLVPATAIYKLLNSIKDDEIEFILKDDKLSVKGKKILATYNVSSEASLLDNLDFEIEEWLEASKDMIKGIKLCRFAASNDASRGPLQGILLQNKNVLAADGNRIACFECEKDIGTQPNVITMDLANQIATHQDNITGWAIKKDIVYIKINDNTIIASKLLAGVYPDALKFIEEGKKLHAKVVLPTETSESLQRHAEQQSEIPTLDREVKLTFNGKELSVASGDNITYEITETIELETEIETSFGFKIHPDFLKDILNRTHAMKYNDSDIFVAFESGQFKYLTTIERVN